MLPFYDSLKTIIDQLVYSGKDVFQSHLCSEMDVNGRNYVRNKMPSVGLGTYQIRNERIIFSIIDAALECGYRFIDTAQIYGNEPAIGRALKELLPKHKLTREDIFITTKLSPANQGHHAAGKSIERSLNNLQTDYIDLLIIHWPGASKIRINDPDNKRLRKESYVVMEEYYKRGTLRSIGISNYEIHHLEDLLSYCSVLPALNQVEYHPHFHQLDLVEYCRINDIHFQAYSSLGSPEYRDQLFNDDLVKRLSSAYSLSVPIFLLAWTVSQGISILPRSSKPERVRENFNAKNYIIDKKDIKMLLENGINHKVCWDPSNVV